MVPWVNQNDVLGHAAVKAFVTQAGINSMYEAIYHAKPVVSVPLITEQAETAARVGQTVHEPTLHGICVPPDWGC